MRKIVEFKNLNFEYDKEHAFKDFNMDINEGDIVTLIGTPASGKTTLLKFLCNKLPNKDLLFKGSNISSYDAKNLQSEIVVIFDEPITETIARDEIKKFVHKIGVKEEEINDRLKEINRYLPLNKLFDRSISSLTLEQKELVKILRYLVISPSFIAIDNSLSNLSTLDKRLFFEYIKKHHITLLNVTTDLNDALFGNKIYVLENFILILEGSTLSVLKMDTLLKRLGFKLPLPVNLSIELNNYDVLKKIYKDNEKLVNALWK